MMTLWITAFMVGMLHALAPDHWFPFVAIAKAQHWTRRKLAVVVLTAGIIHVAAAFLIGAGGIVLGVSLNQLMVIENTRAGFFSFLFIGFGLVYLVWAVKQLSSTRLAANDQNYSALKYFLLALMALGPCEPLIPFLFLGAGHGSREIIALFAVFLVATVGTMMAVTQALAGGVFFQSVPWRIRRLSHVFAGSTIALVGIFVRVLGL